MESHIYPTKCIICGQKLEQQTAQMCEACYNKVKVIHHKACVKCGKPRATEHTLCYDCRHKKHVYQQGRAMFEYNQLTKKSLSGLKFFGYTWIGKVYGELLAVYYKTCCHYPVDYVIPVPISRGRFVQRGYNQAEIIGRAFSKELKLPILANGLRRTKGTSPQKDLSDKERILNMKDAFQVSGRIKDRIQGKNILLVDDIYTTGTTIDSCAKVLMEQGAETIYFLTVAIGNGY